MAHLLQKIARNCCTYFGTLNSTYLIKLVRKETMRGDFSPHLCIIWHCQQQVQAEVAVNTPRRCARAGWDAYFICTYWGTRTHAAHPSQAVFAATPCPAHNCSSPLHTSHAPRPVAPHMQPGQVAQRLAGRSRRPKVPVPASSKRGNAHAHASYQDPLPMRPMPLATF